MGGHNLLLEHRDVGELENGVLIYLIRCLIKMTLTGMIC